MQKDKKPTSVGVKRDLALHDSPHPVLVLAISSTKISVAPTPVRSSITVSMIFFSTIELTATQSDSSKAVIVGARFPGVILVACFSTDLGTLYWQRMYFWAVMTPSIRAAIRSTIF